ncbi:MAG: P63C domain-containing protein [bacterium]
MPKDSKNPSGQRKPRKSSPKKPEASTDQGAAVASGLPYATHKGTLKLGETELQAFVLSDGRRVLSGRTITKAMGLSGRGSGIQRFLDSKSLQPFLSARLIELLSNPIEFTLPGGLAAPQGFEAEIISELCNAVQDANDAKKLPAQQQPLVRQAKIMARGLQGVGIIALVDEATGYQYDRARTALQEILEAFIAKELMPWQKRFPDEFYQEMFRLRRWTPNAVANRRPAIAGKLTNNVVYERLAPGVLDELRSRTPRDTKGRLKEHFHRRLTGDIGHPALRAHLEVVIALMKISPDWKTFIKHLDKTKPVQVVAPLFEEIKPKTARADDEITLAMPGVKPKDALKAFMEVDPDKIKK